MAQFYRLDASKAPWGDYGSILRSGLLATRATSKGNAARVVKIERTGPFIPPITFPFAAIIVTESTKVKMEAARFIGLHFSRAEYAKVVSLDWHTWDATASEPERYPASGEPENYIIKRKHNDRIAASMPAIWTFDVPSTPGLQVMGTTGFKRDRAPNADIFREHAIHWVSDRMKVWLERNLDDWIRCLPVTPT